MVTEDLYGGIGKESERKLIAFCKMHASDHDNATTLAEDAASALDLYTDHVHYPIPERVFEITAEFFEEP